MKIKSIQLWGALLLVGTLQPARAQTNEFFFHDGDQPIVFLGDSITEQRMYTTLIESFVLTRFPSWKVTFRNAGWSGDTAYLARRGPFDVGLKRDVLDLHPAAVTIDFGMNDLRNNINNTESYLNNSTRLVEQIKASGARVALMTSSPVEGYQAGQPAGASENLALGKGAAGLKEVAAQQGVAYVDQYTPFVTAIEQGRRSGVLGATGVPRLTNDNIHPNWAGHLIMADAILKGLKAPSLVSSAEIDLPSSKVVNSQSCRIEDLTTTGGSLTFKRTDDALPMPIPAAARMAFKIPSVTPLEDLSRYTLKVSGLPASRYELLIDDRSAAILSKDELTQGVNLSLQAGVVTEQSNAVLEAVSAKNDLYFQRWRAVQVFEIPAWLQTADNEARRQAELARLDAQIAQKEAAINALRQPKPHVWKLRPVAA